MCYVYYNYYTFEYPSSSFFRGFSKFGFAFTMRYNLKIPLPLYMFSLPYSAIEDAVLFEADPKVNRSREECLIIIFYNEAMTTKYFFSLPSYRFWCAICRLSVNSAEFNKRAFISKSKGIRYSIPEAMKTLKFGFKVLRLKSRLKAMEKLKHYGFRVNQGGTAVTEAKKNENAHAAEAPVVESGLSSAEELLDRRLIVVRPNHLMTYKYLVKLLGGKPDNFIYDRSVSETPPSVTPFSRRPFVSIKNYSFRYSLLGIRLEFSGRFSRAQRKYFSRHQKGRVPLNSFIVPIRTITVPVILKFGVSTVKIWVAYVSSSKLINYAYKQLRGKYILYYGNDFSFFVAQVPFYNAYLKNFLKSFRYASRRKVLTL